MAYTKTNWVDNQTPITADKLNNIENELNKQNISEYDFSNSSTDIRKCIKSGNVVQFTWVYSTTIQIDGWGIINLGTLPEGYRPVYSVYGNLGGYCAGEKEAFFYIDPDGTIKLFNWKDTMIYQPNIFLSCTFIANN